MSDHPNQIQRFEGVPRKTGRRRERTLWKKFLGMFSSRLGLCDELATEYATAYVNELKAEAEIKRNEAAKIADESALERSKGTKAVFSLIDEAFGSNPDVAEQLKIAQLLTDQPHLAEQLRRIAEKEKDLAARYGTRVDVRRASEHAETGGPPLLPPPQDEAV
jgi:hypothetical protein